MHLNRGGYGSNARGWTMWTCVDVALYTMRFLTVTQA
jgi:hypothetical protein